MGVNAQMVCVADTNLPLFHKWEMNTSTKSIETCRELFQRWCEEHERLEELMNDFRQWAYEISQLGIPHFGETADKLTRIRQRLVEHFDREDEIGRELTICNCGNAAVEVESTCSKAAHDHQLLL